MKIRRKGQGSGVRIEMIPLIDVVFLLLVFFIYAMLSMSVHRGIDVELPYAESSSRTGGGGHVIAVTKDGRIFFDKEQVTEAGLEERLADLRKSGFSGRLDIDADREAAYEKVIFVLDSARMAGLKKISLQTHWVK